MTPLQKRLKELKEEWRKVVGFENYEVSNAGRVSHAAKMNVLKPYTEKNGYLTVSLSVGNRKSKQAYIHSLVAEASRTTVAR